MLVVGSKALEHYIKLDRIVHDIDLWMDDYEFGIFLNIYEQYIVKDTPHAVLFDIKGQIVEVTPESRFSPTDRKIFNAKHKEMIFTPYGEAFVPSIQMIYDMKAATAECIHEWKHPYDRNLIEKNFKIKRDTALYTERLYEIQVRIELSKKNKYSFFHKNAHQETKIATIPEYVIHDNIHYMIADLIDLNIPTYEKTINGDTETDLEMFRALPHELKVSLMAEESLVLALERWFIPQMVENGISYKLIPKFYSNNEASPTYALLKHVNVKGLIGEEAEIVQFGRDHFNEIEQAWVIMKNKIKAKGGFPQWFYNEIFEAREKYRAGEQVGIHHATNN